MSSPEIDKPEAKTDKPRRCLKCQAPFLSAWSGHRICDRCKHTAAWREGMSASSYGSAGHG